MDELDDYLMMAALLLRAEDPAPPLLVVDPAAATCERITASMRSRFFRDPSHQAHLLAPFRFRRLLPLHEQLDPDGGACGPSKVPANAS
jgi:hypothetical protein